jgi:hypothetical protein
MIGRMSLWCAGAVLIAASVCASKADAQFISGGGYGLGFFNYGNTGVYMERIPYYALYPPVYYSYPVPRTYGYSPFAYPPGTMTPELPAPVKAAEYINPFVPEGEVAPAVDRSARVTTPVRVARTYINPFVDGATGASTHSVAARIEP